MSSVSKTGASSASEQPVLLQFDDNGLLSLLYGEHDRHLVRLEAQLGVRLAARGDRLAISGRRFNKRGN